MGLASCNDDFMQQIPQTALTVEGFFNTTGDLEVYVNGMYNDGNLYSRGWYEDAESDNVAITINNNTMFLWLLSDQLLPDNAGGWGDWGSLRSINVMLANLDNVTGNEADINNYVGIARYFRAWFYINKVETYSDVPWIDKPLSTTDEELLYATQTPRAEVVRHIFEDLDYAATWIKSDMGNKTRVHKYCALALISRFALHEATFRKYHPELNLSTTVNELLQKSIAASEEIMASGQFEITGQGTTDLSEETVPGVTGATGFRDLFVSLSLSANKEIIHWREYNKQAGANGSDLLMTSSGSSNYSLSRSLQESFLTKDGRPYSTVRDYDKKTFSEVFVDRDPRFAETFAYPGIYTEAANGQKEIRVPRPFRGGYCLGKYFMRRNTPETNAGASLGQYNGLPIYRYGEILLNCAEAKAELGELTPEVINRTINLLRDRVSMPHFDANREVDATLRSLYPNVTDPAMLALRRERRVELACEGLRLKDINRWYAGKVMELDISKQGIYVPQLPYVYDADGDGTPDTGIAASSRDRTGDNVGWFYLNNQPFYLQNGTSGHIRNAEDENRRFDEPKDYYRPIPKNQTVLNPNLTQPHGW
jgi:hypothetical protein